MGHPHLFELFPKLQQRVHWVSLGIARTPVEQHEVHGRQVLVKRDDLTARPYGGNKVRKLEFLLAEATAAGARRVVTAGAFGSHHALATAVYGPVAGLQVSAVLFPQPLTGHVRDVLRSIAAQGAELRFTRRMEGVPFALRRARWHHRQERACIIPPGGSSAVGALGYVEAGLELGAQIATGDCSLPGSIHVAAGTLGTVAGMAIGLALRGFSIPIHAVRITSTLVTNQRVLRALVRDTLALLRGAASGLPDSERVLATISLRHDQVGEGYGRETEAAREAADAFAAAGLGLDGTYTAKAAAAVLAHPPGDHPPLFWHTLSHWPPAPALEVSEIALPQPFQRILAS